MMCQVQDSELLTPILTVEELPVCHWAWCNRSSGGARHPRHLYEAVAPQEEVLCGRVAADQARGPEAYG